MNKNFKGKYNESCLKIFQLLKLLYENDAYYEKVIAIFKDDENLDKLPVVLNKYLNTLKVFGIKITKNKDKFETESIPFSHDFNLDDMKSVYILETLSKYIINNKVRKNIETLVAQLKIRLDENSLHIYNQLSLNSDFGFYYTGLKKQIEICEKFCDEEFKISVKYLLNNKETEIICNPNQIIYKKNNVYLRVYKVKDNLVEDINLSNILEIKQLPVAKNKTEIQSTTTFKLKGRLANAYTLKENEVLNEVCADGSKIITNKNEPVDVLLRRLARYDHDCVIIRPKFLREKMKEFINNALDNYE